MPIALLCCLLSQAVPPGQRVEPPAAVQEVTGNRIEIPALPASVQDARDHYKPTRSAILKELQELEGEILACYQDQGPGRNTSALSRHVLISKQNQQPADVLASYIKDRNFIQLEAKVQEQWNAWQSYLLTKAWLLDGKSGSGSMKFESTMFPLNYVDYEPIASSKVIRIYTTGQELLLRDEITRIRGQFSGIAAIKALDYHSGSSEAQRARAIADQQVRALEALWNPLKKHLETTSDAFLKFEYENRGVPDPGIQILIKKAKIQILERCRYSLWFCLLAWSHLASQPLPELYDRFPGIY